VDSIVTFFPPKNAKTPAYALLFVRQDLNTQLKNPLRRTLPKPPTKNDKLAPVERPVVDQLTRNVFRFAVRNSNGERVLFLLWPVA
jgi:hypothetical protein